EAQIEDEDGRRHPDEAEDELRQGVYGLQHRTLPPTSSSQAMAGASAGSARPARASSAFSARRAEVAPSARILPSPTTIERGQTRSAKSMSWVTTATARPSRRSRAMSASTWT